MQENGQATLHPVTDTKVREFLGALPQCLVAVGITDVRHVVHMLADSHVLDMHSETPVSLIDLSAVERNASEWRRELPMVRPYYAMKAGPDMPTMQLLHRLGFGFDCASKTEIEMVSSIQNIDLDKDVIFAQPCKFVEDLKRAKQLGVRLMTFDTVDELQKIANVYPEAELMLRIRPPPEKALFELGRKFGALDTNWLELLQTLKTKQLKLKGVAFHVGSVCNSPQTFVRALESARRCFLMAREQGLQPSVLDIGGGFCSHREWGIPEFSEFAKAIRESLHQHFSDQPNLTVIAEPGRFILETATTLLATVIGRRVDEVQTESEKSKRYNYFLNDGIYGSLFGIPYGEYLRNEGNTVCLDATLQSRPKHSSTLFGPTCDCTDTVADEIALPELHYGDKLLLSFLGAYLLKLSLGGISEHKTFNGYPRPTMLYYYLM